MNPFSCELATAIVTPFTADNQIDFPALTRLTQHVIDTGSDGIVVLGSTGESPTIQPAEKVAVVQTVKQAIGSQPVKLIVGTGTNDTYSTIEASKQMTEQGIDAILVVVPYYNKPSQAGMIAHFEAVSQAVDIPLMIYNIPGRCVVSMTAETMAHLADTCPNIIGVKQSHSDIDQASEIQAKTPAHFQLWSGDDNLTLPLLSLGATGVVSVASHFVGPQIRQLIAAFKAGQHQTALDLHLQLLPVFKEIFFLPNPTVVKACLAQLGLIQPHLRLPLIPPQGEEIERIDRLMVRIANFEKAFNK